MIHICPYCGGRRFAVTAHVTQDWIVDEYGDWDETINDCVEVTHHPDDDDVWCCAKCGMEYPSGEPFYFIFGSDPAFPYQNTYLIVFARYDHEALDKFRNKYPDRPGHEGTYNASYLYTQDEWVGSVNEKKFGRPAEVIV